MKRVQYFHYGAPEELRLDEVTPPDAGQGQIHVQIRAAAIPAVVELETTGLPKGKLVIVPTQLG